jgi:polyphosphate glucokinase
MSTPRKSVQPKILVVDVGGSHIKCLLSGETTRRKFKSGPKLTPQQMVAGILKITADWRFDALSIGYPGVVTQGAPALEPHHLAPGWVGFDFEEAFGLPVRIVNDAAMQALGSYRGGKMLFLGLGTGLGSALILDGHIVAMELGHLRRSKRHDYEDLLGKRGYKRLGKKKWRRKVHAVVEGFCAALMPDEIVIGGGQADRLKTLPPRSRLGNNAAAFLGGFRLWDTSPPAKSPSAYKDLS